MGSAVEMHESRDNRGTGAERSIDGSKDRSTDGILEHHQNTTAAISFTSRK